jgi:hypothetical protein
MKYQKRVSVGAFLKKGEDIKDGDFIEIANEGTSVEGKFGTQNVFLVKTSNGKDGNVSFNQTSLNNIIDGYGDDSINWIGKRVKIKVIEQIGKDDQYYFLHPKAVYDKAKKQFVIGDDGESF